MKYERPPELSSLPAPRFIDCFRILWWTEKGFVHGMTRGSFAGRLINVALTIMWWPIYPALWVGQVLNVYWRSSRYYMDQERNAVIAIFAGKKGWLVSDHACSQPGTGQGKRLRAQVLPQLIDIAKAQRIPIHATAANRRLAELYRQDLPGMIDAGPGFPRGRKLKMDWI